MGLFAYCCGISRPDKITTSAAHYAMLFVSSSRMRYILSYANYSSRSLLPELASSTLQSIILLLMVKDNFEVICLGKGPCNSSKVKSVRGELDTSACNEQSPALGLLGPSSEKDDAFAKLPRQCIAHILHWSNFVTSTLISSRGSVTPWRQSLKPWSMHDDTCCISATTRLLWYQVSD